ncbi:MAG: hypothetical protein JJT75_01395 [Opitutales bacterium]|nr:hypothetical protein [Opitutales bacterium]MCH8541630.1 hypothetical protein [Opitutales bacterium]
MKYIKRYILRLQMIRALKKIKRVSLSDATRLWSLSNTSFIGPVGFSSKILPEYDLYKKLALETEIEDDDIQALLQHESASVAVYAIEMLILRECRNLASTLTVLADRSESVTIRIGCYEYSSPLCEYAAKRTEEAELNKTVQETGTVP